MVPKGNSQYRNDEWLGGLKQGDHHAFTAIYNDYWEGLLSYISKTVKEQEAAEDLIQDIFVSLWNKRNELDVLDLPAYLYGAARRSALFYLRSAANRRKLTESLEIYLTEVGSSLHEVHAAAELQSIIDCETDKLPPRMREVFILSRRENLTYKEIADKLRTSDQTVKKQMQKVLGILRSRLDALYLDKLALVLFYFCC